MLSAVSIHFVESQKKIGELKVTCEISYFIDYLHSKLFPKSQNQPHERPFLKKTKQKVIDTPVDTH